MYLQLPLAHDVAQIRHVLLEHVALLGLERDTRATQRRKDLPEAFHMVPRRVQEDDDVVEVHKAALQLELLEDHVDGPLEGRRGVGQTEIKVDITIGPLMTSEGCLVTVLVRHGNLPLPRVAVERRKTPWRPRGSQYNRPYVATGTHPAPLHR